MGTKFTVYDSGVNPVKTTSSLEAGNLRQELAAICYVSLVLVSGQQRASTQPWGHWIVEPQAMMSQVWPLLVDLFFFFNIEIPLRKGKQQVKCFQVDK